MREMNVKSKTGLVALFAGVMLVVLFGLCACSSDGRQAESASSGSNTSNGQIALNENTSDTPVPLEEVSVIVYNATIEGEDHQPIEGLADHGMEKLRELSVERVTSKNAAAPGPYVSYIAYRSPKYEQAARYIAEQLDIKGPVHETDNGSTNSYSYDGDIALILCEDWALSEGLVDKVPERAQQGIDQYGDIVAE